MRIFSLKSLLGAPFALLLFAIVLIMPSCGCSPKGYQGDLAGMQAQYPMHPIWSTDEHIVFNADRRVYVVTSDGTSINALPHARGELGLEHATSVSSNGVVSFTRYSCNVLGDGGYAIESVSLIDSSNKRLTEERSYAPYDPIMSPDGSRTVFRSYDNSVAPEHRGDGLFMVYDDAETPQRLAPLVEVDTHPAVWSPDSKMVAFFGNEWHKLIVKSDGAIDGNSIPMPIGFLYVIDIDKPQAVRLFKSESLPTWSPDGEWIAFIRYQGEEETVAIARPDGSSLTTIAPVPPMVTMPSPQRNMFRSDVRGRWLSWSPRGSDILIQRSPFVLVGASGSRTTIMDAVPGAYAEWSPDGSRIAVLLPDDFDGVKLFTMNPDGSGRRALVRWDEPNDRWAAANARPLPDEFGGFVWREVGQ